MVSRFRSRVVVLLVMLGWASWSIGAYALVPKQESGLLASLAFVSEELRAGSVPEALDDVRVTAAAGIAASWDGFRLDQGTWTAVVDQRTGKIEIAEGEGIPFIPGRGNQLQRADITAALGAKPNAEIDLGTMEALTRSFLPRVNDLLGVDPSTLVLSQGRSGHPADHLWYVDFDVVREGLAVDGARVVFRINNGNLIQFGSENLPAPGTTIPPEKWTRQQSLAVVADYVGGFSSADSFVDGGSPRLLPVALQDSRFAAGFEAGKGRGLVRVWQFVFRRAGDHGTWRARVDATSGSLLELRDINAYGQVTGGVKIQGTSAPVLLPMPFADVSSGRFANSAGVYANSGGPASTTLNGRYVRIVDHCGRISQSADTAGNILLGASGGTDCATPGHGGSGNTDAARAQFYLLNRTKEIGRGWLPGNAWLAGQLIANVNSISDDSESCNAFWDVEYGEVNFFRSAGGCGNTGEIEAISVHEYGHGLDSNDGNGLSPEYGTAETYGDWTAALATHNSCIGPGFLLGSNCGGYGDACTSCTGVRDIDWARRASAAPHTVGNFTAFSCPISSYSGPCGREGHCESSIASEALWDFVNRDLPGAGSNAAWVLAERLWYLSRSTATSAFTCTTTSSPWTSDGCNTGSLWKTLRAVDDDDGNLANGTPSSAALYAAFNRHGIACTTDAGAGISFRGCAQPAAPTLSVAPGLNQAAVSWSGLAGVSYDIYRSERGCGAGFVKSANDITGSSFVDNNVANGSYYYQAVAQPAGNEACSSAPSACVVASVLAFPLTVTKAGQGAGTVKSSSPGIDCGTDCSEQYLGGTPVTLTAIPAAGAVFTGWSGACTGTGTCGLTMTSAQTATATFSRAYTLTVSKTGNGTVTSTPAGINCGADCSEVYLANTIVRLTATPPVGVNGTFSWGGACAPSGGGGGGGGNRAGTGASCTVTMSRALSVVATYSSQSQCLGTNGCPHDRDHQ